MMGKRNGAIGCMRILREIEVLQENLLHVHFVHYRSHMDCSGIESGLSWGEAGGNCVIQMYVSNGDGCV
jgi:hypothetical protein